MSEQRVIEVCADWQGLGGPELPKASVVDERGQLWIAKFPSRRDADDVGAWHRSSGWAALAFAPSRM